MQLEQGGTERASAKAEVVLLSTHRLTSSCDSHR
jgi:hypothetical protein